MRAHCVTIHDPFHPALHREVREITAPGPIRALAPKTRRPFIIIRNGEALLRADWDQPLADGDVVGIVLLHQGGSGGGQGGSNPMQALLMMAVMVIAPQMAPTLYTAMGGTMVAANAGLMVSGIQSVLTIGGMALVSAAMPTPKALSTTNAQALANPSPTYNLQAQGNLARLDQSIPVQYGRLRPFPDLAALSYSEFAGNEQYIFQLLCLGQGEYDVESISIEDTPISSWAEVEYEIVPPGGQVTLFPTAVVPSGEVSGQELMGTRACTYSQTGTTLTITDTGHALSAGKTVYLDITSGTAADGPYTVVTTPDANTYTVTAAASATTSGAATRHTYLGPFVASPTTTTANMLGLDLVCPRGLYSYDALTDTVNAKTINFIVETQAIDDNGTPTGGWQVHSQGTLQDSTSTPQRYSFRYGHAAARYQVRVRRTDAKDEGTAVGHELAWVGLRAYLPEVRDFGSVTLIAMRMRASNNLSMQASRKINVVATRKLPVWNGATWSAPVATRSIAWAFADACRNTIYGGKLPDSRIDLASLLALDAIWAARGDHFDGRFDNAVVLWEALAKIARVGRARAYMQGGVVSLVRDRAQSTPVALFSMRNIVRGSMSIDYLMPTDDTADAVEVSYFDETVWTTRRVPCALPDSTSTKPTKVDLFGVTSRDHAHREGLKIAADNRYRRKIIRFATEMDGFIPRLLDLVAIAHDMPRWGQSADAVAWDGTSNTLTLSEPLTWGSGTHYVGLRRPNGSLDGPYAVTAGSDERQVVLGVAPATAIYTGGRKERTHVVFGWGETWRQLALVTAIKPRSLTQVDLECVNEDNNCHTADQGVTTPVVSSSQLSTLYTAPAIAGLTMRSSPSDTNKALMTWQAAAGADYYLIEMANSADQSLAWTRVGETTANNFAVTAIYGAKTWVRVCAVGLTKGPWVTVLFGSVADYMWYGNDSDLMWTGLDTDLMWS